MDQTAKLTIGEDFANKPNNYIMEQITYKSVNVDESKMRCISDAGKCVFCVALNKDNAIPLFSVFS